MGIVVQDKLLPEKHTITILGNEYRMTRNNRMTFHYFEIDMMKMITIMIRPKLEYAEIRRFPHKKKCISKLERIQRQATKMVPELKYFSMRTGS